jgi:membrane protease YdiL (CAAX protease family)
MLRFVSNIGFQAFAVYLLLYLVSLSWWIVGAGQDPTEIVFVGIIFGIIFPAVAWVLTLGAPEPQTRKFVGRSELLLTLAMIIAAGAYLTLGPGTFVQAVLSLGDATGLNLELTKMADKLILFVLVPGLLLAIFFQRRPRDFGWPRLRFSPAMFRHIVIFIVISAMYTVVQLYLGNSGGAFLSGSYSAYQLLALVPVFIWFAVEAGLVEEFLSRAVLQERIAAFMKSDWAGAIVGLVIFATAHAPGLVLRLGHYDWPTALAFSILVLAPAAIVLAVLWVRTRNLLLLAAVHGMGDVVPNFEATAGHLGWTF